MTLTRTGGEMRLSFLYNSDLELWVYLPWPYGQFHYGLKMTYPCVCSVSMSLYAPCRPPPPPISPGGVGTNSEEVEDAHLKSPVPTRPLPCGRSFLSDIFGVFYKSVMISWKSERGTSYEIFWIYKWVKLTMTWHDSNVIKFSYWWLCNKIWQDYVLPLHFFRLCLTDLISIGRYISYYRPHFSQSVAINQLNMKFASSIIILVGILGIQAGVYRRPIVARSTPPALAGTYLLKVRRGVGWVQRSLWHFLFYFYFTLTPLLRSKKWWSKQEAMPSSQVLFNWKKEVATNQRRTIGWQRQCPLPTGTDDSTEVDGSASLGFLSSNNFQNLYMIRP